VKYRIAILAAGTFVIGTDAFAVAGVLPDIASRLNVSTGSVGHLVTAFAIAYAIASPLLSSLTTKWDRRTLLLTALLVFAAGNALCAVAPNYEILFAARIVCGIAAAAFTPTAAATAAMLVAPEARGRALATVAAGLTVATVIGVPIVTLIGTELSFRVTFAVIAGGGLLGIAVIAAAFPAVPTVGGATLRERLDVTRLAGVTPTLAVSLCSFLGGFSVYTYISPLFTDQLGTGATQITWLLLAFGVAGAFGNSFGGWLTDRVGAERCAVIGLFGASAGLLAIPLIGDMWTGAIAAILIWGVGAWMTLPAQQTRLIRLSGPAAPMAISLNASAMYLGIGLAALLGNAVISVSGLHGLGPFGAIMGAVALGLTAIFYRGERRMPAASPQPLGQPHADAIQPNDAGSATLASGSQQSRGLKIAFSLAGLCAVIGVGLFFLLRTDAGEVTVYSSLPLQGPQRARSEDMIRGMRLALKEAGNKAGEFDVKFVSLDDSTAESRGWDSSAVIANATRAAAGVNAVIYIGELNSGASALSIPVLSGAMVPQISPSNTAVGLTTDESGADAGEPGKYYVGGFRNYVRLVPRDTIQGAALATLMKHDGCERAAIIHDLDLYGEGLAGNIRAAMQTQGLQRVLDEPFESREPTYHRTLARRLLLQRADCVVFSGDATIEAVRLFKAVGAALPHARLYGSDGLADRAFTDVNRGGLPEPLAARVKLTVAALGPEGFGAAGKTFFGRFRQEYPDHKNPDPYAIYGYESMNLALDAIERAKSADRKDIVKALFDTKDRSSVIGRYSIDENGDTTLTDYGVFGIRDGAPTFKRAVKPPVD